jgi:Flp pilus assembly protein TadD/glutathione synthase/RimK-type ligase-like ATP-grasp enzyme
LPFDQSAFARDVLARNPNLHAVRASLAEGLLAYGDLEGAVEQCRIALERDDSLLQAWLTRGAAYRALGQPSEAARDLLHAAALAPNRAMILVNLANAYAEQDRLGAAELCLRRAVALEPTCIEAQTGLGSVLVRLGRLDEAEAPCRAALALAPSLVRAHQNLSGILAERDPAAARAHRDAAYRRQQIFVEAAARPEMTVLVLAAADSANVPLRHLLPCSRFSLVHWYIEYATPDQDRALPHFDLVFNAIGDPDLAPDSPEPVMRLMRELEGRVLNRPESVALTRRSNLPQLLCGIAGAVVPRVLHLTPSKRRVIDILADASIAPPVLARPLGSHGGAGVRKIDSIESLDEADAPLYVTQFVEYASPDGWYRKYRAIFIGGRPYPYHLAISRNWLVHYWTSGMENDGARQDEERCFLADPEAVLGKTGMLALEAIGARLDLDYAGIDFALLPTGDILVFEANAAMLVHPEHEGCFAYRNPAVHAILDAFHATLRRRVAACSLSQRPGHQAGGEQIRIA